ncbi:hypothetical protein MPLA_1830300 [Mesorhizobium sp. ORS 3359]|nr:hypothetical protein MPLA_1830300 [Mesorhizobium sp. ORS 3359]
MRAPPAPRRAIGSGPGPIRTCRANFSTTRSWCGRSGRKRAWATWLAQAYVDDTSGDLDALGWELAAAMVRVCNALGAYRSSRGEGVALYLVFKNIRWAN